MAGLGSMNVVLDTCAVLALAAGTLPESATAAVRQAPQAWVSAVTAWEIAIKVAAGKLRLKEPPANWFAALLDRYDLKEARLDAAIACAAAALPLIHRDPFDRVIVALAGAQGLAIVTSDQQIRQYPQITAIW
jgi:PIN domain nuclease of toxin-antitoxin system